MTTCICPTDTSVKSSADGRCVKPVADCPRHGLSVTDPQAYEAQQTAAAEARYLSQKQKQKH